MEANGINGVNVIEPFSLYEHQLIGVDFMTAHPRSINADEMGLGKTLESVFAAEMMGCRRVLVVVLSSTKWKWRDEINKWCPGSSLVVVHGTEMQRARQIAEGARFTVISYSHIRTRTEYEKREAPDGTIIKRTKRIDPKHRALLLDMDYDCIIFDEAHVLRNRKSKTFEAARLLSRVCKGPVWPMTGTPLHTHPEDLWPLLHIINPKEYSSYWGWAAKYCLMSVNWRTGFQEVSGVKDPDALRDSLSEQMLRRLKDDCIDLPPKTYNYIPVELPPAHRDIYKQLFKKLHTEWKDNLIEVTGVLDKITRLRQICISPDLFISDTMCLDGPKVDVIVDLLGGLDEQTKAIVFSQYSTVIDRLGGYIDKVTTYTTITGRVNTQARHARLHAYQNEQKPQTMLSTTGAGGTGTDMFRGSHVLFPDLMWAPAQNNQAVDRAHRIGQVNNVTVHIIYALDTIEEYILEVLGARERMFDATLPVTVVQEHLLKYIERGRF